jgi:hypothetical protein
MYMDRQAQARAGIPLTIEQVRGDIAAMERETKSKAARAAMARLAIKHGNISAEGKDEYRDYLTRFAL